MCNVLHYDHRLDNKNIRITTRVIVEDLGLEYEFIGSGNGLKYFSDKIMKLDPDIILFHPGLENQGEFIEYLLENGFYRRCAIFSENIGEYLEDNGLALIDFKDIKSIENFLTRVDVKKALVA